MNADINARSIAAQTLLRQQRNDAANALLRAEEAIRAYDETLSRAKHYGTALNPEAALAAALQGRALYSGHASDVIPTPGTPGWEVWLQRQSSGVAPADPVKTFVAAAKRRR